MGEEFYAIIKLVSGEEIMSLVMADETEEDTIFVLQNPFIMKKVKISFSQKKVKLKILILIIQKVV